MLIFVNDLENIDNSNKNLIKYADGNNYVTFNQYVPITTNQVQALLIKFKTDLITIKLAQIGQK